LHNLPCMEVCVICGDIEITRASLPIRKTRKKLICLCWLIVLRHLIKYTKCKLSRFKSQIKQKWLSISPDEFDLFSTYLYLFGNKRVKYKLSFFRVFLMHTADRGGYNMHTYVPLAYLKYLNKYALTANVSAYVKYANTFACQNYLRKIVVLYISNSACQKWICGAQLYVNSSGTQMYWHILWCCLSRHHQMCIVAV